MTTTKSRILIVDDVIDNIRVAISILEENSFDFFFAQSGKEALRLIYEELESFDLILLDVMMPGIDGFNVCQKLKKTPGISDIPVIFLTARVDIDSISKGFELGGVDYITKPFHADELLARVKTHLNLHHAKALLKKHNIDMQTKVNFERQRILTELEDNQKEMIYILADLMEVNSDETGNHIRRVSESSSLMAKYHPTLSLEDSDTLYHASPLHDIGKMSIPLDLLNKTGLYTDEEFELMKQHTSKAHELLSRSGRKLIKAAAIIAHEHHERWNGSGYPRGLNGANIHIFGRIVGLTDVFDSLTHKRNYREAWSLDDAVNYIIENRDKLFDPQLVDIFVAHLDEFKSIAESK